MHDHPKGPDMDVVHDIPRKVGRGRPPKATQFKKGQSGNPSGRPKGSRNFKAIFQEQMLEPITVKEGDKLVSMPLFNAAVKKLVSTAIKGDTKVCLRVVELALDLSEPDEHQEGQRDTPPDELAIFDAYIKRGGRVS